MADRASGVGLAHSTERLGLGQTKSSIALQDESARGSKKTSPKDAGIDALSKIRKDLSEAQRSKGAMELEIQSLAEENQKLRVQSKLDRKRISELALERTNLATRMKDRDEELKGKAKLLEVSLYFLAFEVSVALNSHCFTAYSRRDRVLDASAQHGGRAV